MFDISTLMNFLPDFLRENPQALAAQSGTGNNPMFLSPEAMAVAPGSGAANPANPLSDLFSKDNMDSLRKQLIMQAIMNQGGQQQAAPAPMPHTPMMPAGGGMPTRFNQQQPAPMPSPFSRRRFLGQ